MTKEQKLLTLFDSHSKDLNDVFLGAGDIFVCPICLNEFKREDIRAKKLTDGHVWPDYIRHKNGSRIVRSQSVLLCKNCNNRSGSHGDIHMQEMEKVREGEESGILYGDRRIQIVLGPCEEPINLNVSALRKTALNLTIMGELDKKGKWKRNDPKMQERFKALERQNALFNILLHPYHRVKPEMVRAGWITAAYLFAFYSLGYRYILPSALNEVRGYILHSFVESDPTKIDFSSSNAFNLGEYNDFHFPTPEIDVIVPLDNKTPVHIQVNFQRYQVRLPFFYIPSVLAQLIYFKFPYLPQMRSELAEAGNCIYLPITCSKIDVHDCFFDYLLGKPLPRA
jgi:hypothetical protein